MPWMALPFEDRERKAKLSSKFKVQGIPTLVIVDENGKTITTDGRAAITGNPSGFPWAPKPFKDLLGTTLRKSDGTVVPTASLGNKNLVLYFSAHWCPPCRQTTPLLAKLYQSMRSHRVDDFEFIFISSDKDMKSFSEYHGEMPWLAMPFDKRAEKEELSNRYGVEGIPSLIVVDPEGNVINKVCVDSYHTHIALFCFSFLMSLTCNLLTHMKYSFIYLFFKTERQRCSIVRSNRCKFPLATKEDGRAESDCGEQRIRCK
jgi:nucleoredoxin